MLQPLEIEKETDTYILIVILTVFLLVSFSLIEIKELTVILRVILLVYRTGCSSWKKMKRHKTTTS